jgi:hypothetical protein
MILHCKTSIHPLLHAGTQQRERLVKALIPGNLKIDDRSVAELLAFAGRFAKHVRYWNHQDKDEGNWEPFWRSDVTALLAIIAATDIESAIITFRENQLKYISLKKKEDTGEPAGEDTPTKVLNNLVADNTYGIYGVALMILRICQQAPENHPIKKDIISIVETKLQPSFRRLIQFHKAVDEHAIEKYRDFISAGACAAPWNIRTVYEFECIDYVSPSNELFEEIWKLFLKFIQALSLILEKAKKGFNSALRSRRDHQPHITLFLAFLHLFRYLQTDLNSLTEKHLLFYYEDILRLQQRRFSPDKVHIVFELAENVSRYRIIENTLLPAGEDIMGAPILYALEDELVAGKAKLVEKQNFYFKETSGKDVFAFILPAADMRDGIDEPFVKPEKAWHPLSSVSVYERFNYKYRQIEKLEQHAAKLRAAIPLVLKKQKKLLESKLLKLKGMTGFTISTPEFWMEKTGIRFMFIEFDITVDNVHLDVTKNLLDDYVVEISTDEGLVPLQVHPVNLTDEEPLANGALADSLREFVAELSTPDGDAAKDPEYKSNNRIAKVDDRQIYVVALDRFFPNIVPVDAGTPPFIRFRSKNNERPEGQINFIQVSTLSATALIAHRGKEMDQPFLMHRVSNGVYETGKKFFITEANGEENIVVKFPELFAKDLRLLVVESGGTFEITHTFLSNDASWKALSNNGSLPGYVYKEKAGDLFAPETFDFNAERPITDGWIRLELNVANLPVVVESNKLGVLYYTNKLRIPVEAETARIPEFHTFRYFTSLGEWLPDQKSPNGFRPTPHIEQPTTVPTLSEKLFKKPPQNLPANGNLFLGFENLVPTQTLSLLFKTAEGTGNPDHFAPKIIWSYLSDNEWIEFAPQFILKDETLGLKQTGIIRFQIPGDITNGNTWIKGKENRTDLYWIRASATEFPDDFILVDALPMLRDIYVNAATAIFENNHNSQEHLVSGIPAESISSLRFRDVNVKTVLQPYGSFGGRLSEAGDRLSYYQRINERLRHKHRAVTIWDYERLTLEKFTDVALAKCLSHTWRFAVAMPGYVTIAVIPYPDKMVGTRKYYPNLDAGTLETIRDYLVRQNSMFVGRYGEAEFCCCDDDCQCEKPDGNLTVINPRFEPVRLKLCVRFVEGKDIAFYKKQLNEELKHFLAPWADDNRKLAFGIPISKTSLLQFLENLDYIDVILNLEFKRFATRQQADEGEADVPWQDAEIITPHTSASILTTYLDRLNEDNPNVIDHEINVVEKHDRCSCASCIEDEPVTDEELEEEEEEEEEARLDELKKIIGRLWKRSADTNAVIREFQTRLNEFVDEGILHGQKIAAASEGTEGVHAYRIEKVKAGNRIQRLRVSVCLAEDHPFTTFTIDNPHLNN